jgi:amidase
VNQVRRRLSGFIRRPSADRIRELAALEHMTLTQDDAADIAILVDRYLAFMDRLDDLPLPELEVRYSERDKGRRPTPEEDPFNLFIRRCRVVGAKTGKLAGKTVAVKDNISVAGVPTTNGSRMIEGFVPDIDATVVERLLDAGATIVGKLNCDDFSFSGTSETSHFGVVPNPHNPAFSAGGSSSGAAAAIVTGAADIAIGVDNGGSARIPGSWCGVPAIKATHGLVPTFGITYLSHTTDFVCPLGRTVADVALALEVIAGHDPKDPQWVRGDLPVEPYSERLEGSVSGLRIGVLDEALDPAAVEADVADAFHRSIRLLEQAGATRVKLSLPIWRDAQAIWNGFVAHDVSTLVESNLEGFNRSGFCNLAWQAAFGRARRTRGDLLPPVLKVLMIVGRYLRDDLDSLYFSKATNIRFGFRQQVDALFDEVDVIATPTTPTKAYRLSDKPIGLREVVESRATSMAMNTYPANVSGHPAITVPCGTGENNLPIGLQFIGPKFGEARILRAAHQFETLFGSTGRG